MRFEIKNGITIPTKGHLLYTFTFFSRGKKQKLMRKKNPKSISHYDITQTSTHQTLLK